MTAFDDLELPKTAVTRIVKSHLSKGVLLQKDVKEGLSRSATLFVSYLTATVHDLVTTRYSVVQQGNRGGGEKLQQQKMVGKSIQVEHIYKALEILEFESFVPILKRHLEVFQKARKQKLISQSAQDKTESDAGDVGEEEAGELAEEPLLDVHEESELEEE